MNRKIHKKGEFPLIKTIIILIIAITILLTYALLLTKSNNITINDKKLRAQLLINKIFTSKCLSDEYGIFNEKKLTHKIINQCFENKNIHDSAELKFGKIKTLYINQEEFETKKEFCEINTNLYCGNMIYPIIINRSGKLTQTFLYLKFIIT